MENLQFIILKSPVSAFLFLITIVTSLAAFRDPGLKAKFVLHPWSFVRDKKYYQIITSGLIHADGVHLLFNSIAFYYFGFSIFNGLESIMLYEQSVAMTGSGMADWMVQTIAHGKFLFLYIASLIVADMASIIQHKDNPAFSSLGASGAISGMVISFIVLRPTGYEIWFMPGWMFGIVYIVVSYFLGKRGGGRVNHFAHMWGGIAGLIFTLAMFPNSALVLWYKILEAIQ